MKRTNRKKARTDRPTLPELDQTKGAVLNSLTSLQSRRSCQHAMDEVIQWYCSEPRLALNRAVVLRYPAITALPSNKSVWIQAPIRSLTAEHAAIAVLDAGPAAAAKTQRHEERQSQLGATVRRVALAAERGGIDAGAS